MTLVTILSSITLPVAVLYFLIRWLTVRRLNNTVVETISSLETTRRLLFILTITGVVTFILGEVALGGAAFSIEAYMPTTTTTRTDIFGTTTTRTRGGGLGIVSFVIASILWALFIFGPLVILTRHVKTAFKKLALSFANKKLPKTTRLEASSLMPSMDKQIFMHILWFHPEARNLITSANSGFGLDCRCEMVMEDLFHLTLNTVKENTRVDFWEARMLLKATQEETYVNVNMKEKTRKKTLHDKEYLDGIWVKRSNAFASKRDLEVLATQGPEKMDCSAPAGPRAISGQVQDLMRWDPDLVCTHNSFINGWSGNPNRDVKVIDCLDGLDPHLWYVVVSGQDLYLFFHTAMNCNLFELNMRKSVKSSIQIFHDDIDFCRKKADILPEVFDRLSTYFQDPSVRIAV